MKNRLEELRKQRGIKQEELAEAVQVSRQTIGSLENGRYNRLSCWHLSWQDILESQLKIFSYMRRMQNDEKRKKQTFY